MELGDITMDKKLQVFVSSTYIDLIEERQAAVEAILDAGHIPAGMELFKAGKSQMKTIRKWIDESDVYMLILGGRYGSIEEESGLSYTELEYRYALSKGMPVFAIVLDDSFLFTKAAVKGKDIIFEEDNIDKYDSFKKYVKTNIVRFPKNIDQIVSIIHSHLNDILNNPDYKLIGWVRTNLDYSSLKDTSSNINSNSSSSNELYELYETIKNQTCIITPFFTHKSINCLDFFIKEYSSLCSEIEFSYTIKQAEAYSLLESYDLIEKIETGYRITKKGVQLFTMLTNNHLLPNKYYR